MIPSAYPVVLVVVLALALFLGFLNLAFWLVQRKDTTPLWLATWLAATAFYVFCRILQYAPLAPPLQALVPRCLLTAAYFLVWIGYGLANSFICCRASQRERLIFALLVALLIGLLWGTDLILTDQLMLRSLAFGGDFMGVEAGPLYLPAGFLALTLSAFPAVRLIWAGAPHKGENYMLAAGYIIVILFSLSDFLATSLSLSWIRFSDFSYLPIAIFFSVIQVRRFGQLYRDMDARVQEQTATLRQSNEALRAEMREHEQAEGKIRQHAAEMTILFETTHDLVMEQDLSRLLHVIVERAVGYFHASGGGLYLCEPEQQRVRCVVSYNTLRDYTGVVLKYGEGSAGIVAATGEPLLIADYRTWEGRATVYEQDHPFIAMISVPMRWQEQVIGVIHVLDNTRPNAFAQNDLQLLSLFANQAATAVQNARLFDSEKRRRQEAAVIAEVGREITASLHLDDVLERIAWHARDLLHADTSAVYLADPAKPTLRAIAAIGPDEEEIKQDPLVIGDGILGAIAACKVGEIVNDSATDPRAVTIQGTQDVANEHLMGIPILSRDRLIGLIAVWRTGAGLEFTSPDMNFLVSLAQQAAIAIDNARLFEETRIRLREIESIASVSAALSRTLELEPLLEIVLQSAIRAIPAAERGSILMADPDGNLCIRATYGFTDPRVRSYVFPPASGYSAIAFREQRAIVVPDVRAQPTIRYDGEISEMRAGGSAVAAPLVVKGCAIGVIAIDTTATEDAFSESDLHLLEALASPAALAIENSQLFEDTRRRLAELEIMQSIASALRIAQAPDEVFPIVLVQLINLLGVGSALVDLIEPASGEIVTQLAHGVWAPMTGRRTPITAGGSGRVIATGQPYISTDVIADGLVAFPDLIGDLRAAICVPIVAMHQPIGTLWIGRVTPLSGEEVNLLVAVGEMVGNTIQRMKLHEQTVRQADELAAAYDLTLEGWAKALELRDKETEGHSRRVTELTLQLAHRIGVPAAEMANIRRGVLLHDIGKMGVSDQVLKKTGLLDDHEWHEMRKHPQYAYELLYPITYLRPALDIPYCHHEKWDGQGYPRGLQGKQIPLAARIFAVVDVYDALSNDRPYRAAWPKRRVIEYLRNESGKHFDPEVVEVFIEQILEPGI